MPSCPDLIRASIPQAWQVAATVEWIAGSKPGNDGFSAMKSDYRSKALYPQIPVLDVLARRELARCALPHHAALLDDDVPVGEADEIGNVLVDHENGKPAVADVPEGLPDLAADQRCQALGYL